MTNDPASCSEVIPARSRSPGIIRPIRRRRWSIALGVLIALVVVAEAVVLWQAVNFADAFSIYVVLPLCALMGVGGLWLASRLG
jgi:hypothetical protein